MHTPPVASASSGSWVCRWSWPHLADGVGPTTLDLLLLAFVVSSKDIDEGLLGGSEFKGETIRKYATGSW